MDFFRARPGPAPGRGNDSNPAYMNNGRLFKVREIFAGLTHKPHETGCVGQRAINRSGLPGFPQTARAATR